MANPTIFLQNFNQTISLGNFAQFPSDLAQENKFMKLSVLKYRKEKFDQKEKEDPVFTIFLPLPFEMTHTDSLSYDDTGGLIENLLTDSDFLSKANVFLATQGKKILGSDSATIAREFTESGLQINPQLGIYFSSPQLKVHAFRYNLIAKNSTESKAIRTIVNRLRYYSHPEVKSGEGNLSFFEHPEIFKIQFTPDSFMYKPNLCSLIEFGVSYNDQSNGMFYDDDAPVDVTFQMTFKEITVETKNTLRDKHPELPRA